MREETLSSSSLLDSTYGPFGPPSSESYASSSIRFLINDFRAFFLFFFRAALIFYLASIASDALLLDKIFY